MNAFLTKPLDPTLLVRTLHSHVSKIRGLPVVIASSSAQYGQESATPWPAIEGIDAAQARSLLQGDAKLFVDLLSRFVRDYGAADFRMTESDRPETRTALVARVHKLRGSAGMLGANTLHALASTLETRLRDLENPPQKREPINASVAGLIVSLNDALRHLAAASAGAIATFRKDAASLPNERPVRVADAQDVALDEAGWQRIETFRQLLERQDLSAMEQVDVLAPELTVSMGVQAVASLRDAIHSLNFAAALLMVSGHLPPKE